jgi:hypothetical protein
MTRKEVECLKYGALNIVANIILGKRRLVQMLFALGTLRREDHLLADILIVFAVRYVQRITINIIFEKELECL